MLSHWLSVCPSICPYVCPIHPSVFSFLGDNLSKCQWIFPKLGMCIDIMEIWFEIANGQISSIFDTIVAGIRWGIIVSLIFVDYVNLFLFNSFVIKVRMSSCIMKAINVYIFRTS